MPTADFPHHRRRFLLAAGLGAAGARGLGSLAGEAGTAGIVGLAATGAVPRPAHGQEAGSTRQLSLRDAARGRDVPVLIRFPAGSGPCPAVLYSHGLGGNRHGAEVWSEAWRAAGIAVVHLQHPGSDAEVLRDGGAQALREAMNPMQLMARVRDVRFVIDEIARAPTRQDSPLQRMDIDALGVAGHSFGALTVQAVAGQRMPGFGDFADTRPRAFIAFSPVPFGAQASAGVFADVTRPFLAVTGSMDGDDNAKRGGSARAALFESLPPGQRALLWLEGADHMTFAGSAARRLAAQSGNAGPAEGFPATAAAGAGAPNSGPSTGAAPSPAALAALLRRDAGPLERESRHHALVGKLTAQWWRAHLMNDSAAAAQLRKPTGLAAGDKWRT